MDPNRFLPTSQSFPYIPPFGPVDPVPTTTYAQQNSVIGTASHSTEVQYDVSFTVSASIKAPIEASLEVTASLQWTNTSSSGTSEGSTQSATVTVGGPAFGYAGPTDVLVYLDTVYNSFMFAFPTEAPAASGKIVDHAGLPIPHKEVTLVVGGHTLRTFTDSYGDFRLYGAPAGHPTVSITAKDTKAQSQPFSGIIDKRKKRGKAPFTK